MKIQNPRKSRELNQIGFGLAQTKKYREAVDYFEKAIQYDPKNYSAYINLGASFSCLLKYQEALHAIENALSLNPNFEKALVNKGLILWKLARYDEAGEVYRKLTSLYPDNLVYWDQLGICLFHLLQIEEAVKIYQQCIKLHPTHLVLKTRCGILLLLLGDYKRGFAEYEYRLGTDENPKKISSPRWLGKPIEKKTLFVQPEQGLGDIFHFIRYVPLLSQYHCKIILELPLDLHLLFVDLNCQLSCPGWLTPKHDFQVSLLSLPWIFKTNLSTVPAPISIKCTLHPVPNRIGITWKGEPKHPRNEQRSVELFLLEPLFQMDRFHFVSLQKETTENEVKRLEAYEVERLKLNTWTDTVQALETCERVICVDTSIAHLAGSMGIPTWILLTYAPDWRWLLNRSDSPWYPSVTLFRQTIKDSWAEPLNAIRTSLDLFRN